MSERRCETTASGPVGPPGLDIERRLQSTQDAITNLAKGLMWLTAAVGFLAVAILGLVLR